MDHPFRILHLEDDPADIRLVRDTLAADGLAAEIVTVDNKAGFLAALDRGGLDLILADYRLPAFDGLEALTMCRARCDDTPFIFLTGAMGEERAVETLKSGATDYVLKERLCQLAPAVRRALAEAELQACRQEAERALRESQERLALAAEAAQVGIFEWDIPTGTMQWTVQHEVIFGYPCTATYAADRTVEHTYQEWASRVHSDDLPWVEEQMRASMAQHLPFTADYRVLWPNGSLRWASTRGSFYYDTEGRAVQMLGTAIDITDRKQAEARIASLNQDLQRRVAELETIFNTAPIGIAIADDPQCRNMRGNPAFAKLLGVQVDSDWSRDFLMSERPESFRAMRESRRLAPEELPMQIAATRGVAISNAEFDLVHNDGRVVRLFCNAAPLFDEHGKPRGAVGAFMDIGELKKTQKQLEEAKVAAEEANVAKSQFLANISHELRTPMNAILGMIDVALPKAADSIIQDCLQTAKGSADLLLTLLNDLLDSAKIESGKLELEAAPFSLRRMLNQVTCALSVRASEHGLCFFCRIPETTPDAVVGDRMRLQQVLLNLAGNAIKFTERGKVEISLRNVPQDGADCFEFAVRDTGIGIPPSSLERLFQPFSQADASMARRFGGTGLGLSISRSLVELMGGRIWVESSVGTGSTFYFTLRLPFANELPIDVELLNTVTPEAASQLRILLVEDNAANQKLATYILRDRGHLVEIAEDGREAIDLAEKDYHDVILMDVQMPVMSGLDATAVIRRREAGGRRVPIIAMTAEAMKGDHDRCLAAGMDGYLSKPVNAQEMIAMVENLARRAASPGESAVPPNTAELSQSATSLVFNRQEATALCNNCPDLVEEMIRCFLADANNVLPQMQQALAAGNLKELDRLAHGIKGTVVYLGAQPFKEATWRLERLCRRSDATPSEALEAFNAFEQEFGVLKAALTCSTDEQAPDHPTADRGDTRVLS